VAHFEAAEVTEYARSWHENRDLSRAWNRDSKTISMLLARNSRRGSLRNPRTPHVARAPGAVISACVAQGISGGMRGAGIRGGSGTCGAGIRGDSGTRGAGIRGAGGVRVLGVRGCCGGAVDCGGQCGALE
jgi:hypothetical protein